MVSSSDRVKLKWQQVIFDKTSAGHLEGDTTLSPLKKSNIFKTHNDYRLGNVLGMKDGTLFVGNDHLTDH